MEEEAIFKGRIEGDKLNEVTSNCKFQAEGSAVLITMNSIVSESDLDIIETEERMIDNWQYVISSGNFAKFEPGDKVYLNLKRMARTKHDRASGFDYEVLDLMPYIQDDVVLTIIDSSYILGKEVTEKGPDLA